MSAGLLAGRVAVVTGGARGIGRAVARAFAEAGAAVAIADVDEGAAADAAEAEAAQTGARVGAVGVDVTSPASLEAAADSVERRLGPVGVLVANAGILHLAPVLETDPADFRRVLEVNLTGAFLSAKVFGARMVRAGGGGRIVFSSSLFGVRGGAENGAYSASKFGVVGLTQCLAAELAPHGILVNAVCPGQVRTDMMDRLVRDRSALTGRAPEQVEADLLAGVPLGRMAGTDEIADTYVYLASDLSRYVTGQSLVVDGGMRVG